ncbi:hypothetical protein IVB03_23390 [Bradyrhizobium sp. 168]|uniref:hypothetical protein n=1 Tax=Bradyrhizobium sp. 168 TaxID=2782639 RepID=UPI001FFA53D1|nr:hypothetical protein [Bradyrhizobium sp. 168]MCK1582427.1 hypothetical protein [Bradyrhizobium sp. 168]
MTKQIAPALSPEALLGKSKAYISRALAAKNTKDMGEYQLWASLALELLGKWALAEIHPCLVADPQGNALLAAIGINVATDIKTITAKTVFERLGHVSKRFDKKTEEHCTTMSLKRNAELHSGEVPFAAVLPGAWEGRFWHTAAVILDIHGKDIEVWLGIDPAKAPKQLMADYTHAIEEAAKIRVETAADQFAKLTKAERNAAQAHAKGADPLDMRRSFKMFAEKVWAIECPACKSNAFLAGVCYGEEASDDDNDPFEELVVVLYVAEEFYCPACGLRLGSREEIEAVDLDVEHTETEARQREYEPDYGND